MFTHRVQMQLRADSFILLSKKIDATMMPFLGSQKGFINGVTTIIPERSSATGDTHWGTREEAEAYQRTGYPEMLKMLSEVVSAEPVTSIFEGAYPTFSAL